MDQLLSYFDHPPILDFREHLVHRCTTSLHLWIWQYLPNFTGFTECRWGYNFQVYLGLPTNPIILRDKVAWWPQKISSSTICLSFFWFWSTWTFDCLPTYLKWTIVDIWLTTYLPHPVHEVFEQPPTLMVRTFCPAFGSTWRKTFSFKRS